MYVLKSITGEVLCKLTKMEADRLSKVLKTREPRVWDLENGGFVILRNVGICLPEDNLIEDDLADTMLAEIEEELENTIGETSSTGGLEQPDTLPEEPEVGAQPKQVDGESKMISAPIVEEGDLCECGGEMEIRKRIAANGATQVMPQCTKCLKKGKLMKKDLVEDLSSLNTLE
jgi:hypothetical protein